jgi:hypothetical protein
MQTLQATSGLIPLVTIKLQLGDNMQRPGENITTENYITGPNNEMLDFIVRFDEKLFEKCSPCPEVSSAASFLIILLITTHFRFCQIFFSSCNRT